MPDTQIKHVRLRISGRVQGVWYRGWTVDTALAQGIDGWVRNRADGTVEAVFSGQQGAVDAMVAACWQGPPSAQVLDIKIIGEPNPPAPGFLHRPSC